MATSRPERGGLLRRLLPALGIGLLAALCGCSTPTPTQDLAVRVFVDRNDDGIWNTGDIGVPEVIVSLDGEQTISCDTDGCAVFSDVSGSSHRIIIPPAEVRRLSDCGLAVRQAEQAVPDGKTGPIVFLVDPVGFLNVEVDSTQTRTASEPEAKEDEDCECTKEG